MSDENKPIWLRNNDGVIQILSFDPTIAYPDDCEWSEKFINYSAYDQLKKENEKLIEALETYTEKLDEQGDQIEQLKKENEQLKADIESRKVSYYELDEINTNLNCEIRQLKSKLKVAVEALEFYADEKNLDLTEQVIIEDGTIAKEALKDIGEI